MLCVFIVPYRNAIKTLKTAVNISYEKHDMFSSCSCGKGLAVYMQNMKKTYYF